MMLHASQCEIPLAFSFTPLTPKKTAENKWFSQRKPNIDRKHSMHAIDNIDAVLALTLRINFCECIDDICAYDAKKNK
jgi:hypothetical protein